MKRGTPDHPKTRKLARHLDISISHAVGLLECMWHFTARYAIQGDVGKHTDEAIAEAMYWAGPAKALVTWLIDVGWLDIDDTHRLLVHHWYEHADQSVKKTLQNKDLQFFHPTGRNDSSQSAEKVSPSLSLSRSLSSALPEPEPSQQASPEPQDGSRAVLIYPTNGPVKKWGLHQDKIDEWQESYPGLDVMAECCKACQWCKDNKLKRKTARGMTRFLGAWLMRENDKGKRAPTSSVDDALAGMEDGDGKG